MEELKKVIESLNVIKDYCDKREDCECCGCYDYRRGECYITENSPNSWITVEEPIVKTITKLIR